MEVCCSIKNRLLHFAKVGELTPALEADLRQLIEDIGDFNRSYKKKKTKKKKRDDLREETPEKEEPAEEEKEVDNDEDTDNVNYREPQCGNAASPVRNIPVAPFNAPRIILPQMHVNGSPVRMSPTTSFGMELVGKPEGNPEQGHQINLSKSMEFEFEEFLRNGPNNPFYSRDSPSFLPLRPPRFQEDSQPSSPLSPLFRNPFDSGG